MPRLFTYGTLQRKEVQRATFGRTLEGARDALPGYERSRVRIASTRLAATSGLTHHTNVHPSNDPTRQVAGVVLSLSDAELAAADVYEHEAEYRRIGVTLASGSAAWVYVYAGSEPLERLEWEGGCLCGQLRYRAIGPLRDLCFCHCTSCRRATGAPMVPWGTVDRDDFLVTAGRLSTFESSPGVTRGFCATCGTSLTYQNARRAPDLDLALATLDDPSTLTPQCHLWVQEKLPWIEPGDGLTRHATHRA
jgi:gamma-glutamylcyclotransferase (GGCT)/AIG2-like uncharacterized protein YtfP